MGEVVKCCHCDKPITDPKKAIRYEGKIFHNPCAIASESGEMPPDRNSSHLGLWGFTNGR